MKYRCLFVSICQCKIIPIKKKVMSHIFVFILLSVFFAEAANDFNNKISTCGERQFRALKGIGGGAKPSSKLKTFLKSEDFQNGVPDLLEESTGGIGKMFNLDFDKPARQIVADIGDIVVPILSIGLSFIPGVGPIISGLVNGIYSILSPLIRGPVENPMAVIVKDIYTQLRDIKLKLNTLGPEIKEDIRKEREAELRKIVSAAFHAETRRNEYICGKYAAISKQFSERLRCSKNKTIDDALKFEMIAQIQDCDNFLKDTSVAFVGYPKYIDVLWFPTIITTYLRATFLTEVSNFAVPLKMAEVMIRLFWKELKTDLKNHFRRYVEVVRKRNQESFQNLDDHFTIYDYFGCMLQRQLLYLDRQMYPFGVPNPVQIHDNKTQINISDFNATQTDKVHIQVLYNEYHVHHSGRYTVDLVNCIMGQDMVNRFPTDHIIFYVNYVSNKFYQIRILYFLNTPAFEALDNTTNVAYATSSRKNNDVLITLIEDLNETNSQRFEYFTAYHTLLCKAPVEDGKLPDQESFQNGGEICVEVDKDGSEKGNFVVETADAFNVGPKAVPKGKITFKAEDPGYIVLFGVELIVRPYNPLFEYL